MPKLKQFFPLLMMVFLILVIYTLAYFSPTFWDSLKELHLNLKTLSEHHPIVTPFVFMMIYILYAFLSLPGIVFLSLIAGFLFRQPFSTIYVVSAATIGASLLFLVARTAFGHTLYQRSGNLLQRLEKNFRKYSTNYLLFLRLLPLFPFWMVNLAGAFFGISFWAFVWTTFVGMIPSVFVFTQVGRGLTCFFECSNPLSPLNLVQPHVILALIGLALFSLLPILFKKLKNDSTQP